MAELESSFFRAYVNCAWHDKEAKYWSFIRDDIMRAKMQKTEKLELDDNLIYHMTKIWSYLIDMFGYWDSDPCYGYLLYETYDAAIYFCEYVIQMFDELDVKNKHQIRGV